MREYVEKVPSDNSVSCDTMGTPVSLLFNKTLGSTEFTFEFK